MERFWQVVKMCSFFALGFALGYGVCDALRPCGVAAVEEVRVDTLVYVDTVSYAAPMVREVRGLGEKEVVVRGVLRDTIFDSVRDTLYDSVRVLLPFVQRHYLDSCYEAWVSGYEAALDSVRVYPRREVLTVTHKIREPPKRFGVGVQAGYGVGKNGLQPYVGIGVSYMLFGF